MTLREAMDARHSVRAYKDKPIEQDIRDQLNACADECNRESGLNIVIRYDDPAGFDTRLAHYGLFTGISNYIVLKGKRTADFEFLCGYNGEKIVLYAQQLGLNTCWTAMTFNKKMVKTLVPEGETLCMAIALGYGESQGKPHKGKSLHDVINVTGGMPEWFVDGVNAALLAPTAVNQQKFVFTLDGGEPAIRVKGFGSYTRVDLGIVAYHFDAVTGKRVNH